VRIGPDPGKTASAYTDYLEIEIYDEIDSAFDLYFNSVVDFSLGNAFQRITLDISALAGRSIAFSFNAHDENDGVDNRFYIDNVSFATAVNAVPAPTCLTLMLVSLAGLLRIRKQRRWRQISL
jgi:hypothetical protein